YKPCVTDAGPSICHYYGLDEENGRLVHVHAYYRILTGGTVLKNYRLPLEEMLLCGTRQIQGVFVPSPAAELVSFVVRKTLEHASVLRSSRFLAGLARRVVRRGPTRVLLSGGAVVAVVGSDGAGKSTVVGELTAWLGTSLRVRRIHAGKPPAAVTTAGLRVL